MAVRLTSADVLRYPTAAKCRATAKRHYEKWRSSKKIPLRCDKKCCTFHFSPLTWNGLRLPLILDHISGNSKDNNPENLQLLCPNCDAQAVETRGGANKGRIRDESEGGYGTYHTNGRIDRLVNLGGVGARGEAAPLCVSKSTETDESLPTRIK